MLLVNDHTGLVNWLCTKLVLHFKAYSKCAFQLNTKISTNSFTMDPFSMSLYTPCPYLTDDTM